MLSKSLQQCKHLQRLSSTSYSTCIKTTALFIFFQRATPQPKYGSYNNIGAFVQRLKAKSQSLSHPLKTCGPPHVNDLALYTDIFTNAYARPLPTLSNSISNSHIAKHNVKPCKLLRHATIWVQRCKYCTDFIVKMSHHATQAIPFLANQSCHFLFIASTINK